MTTPLRRRSLRARLLALITTATDTLAAAWRILTRAQQALLTVLARIRPGRTANAAIRAAAEVFQRSIGEFDRTALGFIERWAATDLPTAYRAGGTEALTQAGRDPGQWAWTDRHQSTITALSAQYYTDLTNRVRESVRRARAFLRDALDAARHRVDRFRRSPWPSRAALLRDHPLDTVIYAGNTRHPATAWAHAALAWQTYTTANTGLLRTTADEVGADWIEVQDGPGCGWTSHGDGDMADGSLRTVQDALAHPVAHPHCRRSFRPRPDVISRPDYAFGGLA
ncbi:hypothetical protein [Streptomyces gardneri]|uniref:hypothetical protein n=1 Tax=Streptomyces gardneri TaxID=66892 RepID=UPI003677A2FD